MAKSTNLALSNPVNLAEIKKNVKFSLTLDSNRVFQNLWHINDDLISKNWHNIDVSQIQKFNSNRLFKLFAANDSSFSASLLTHVRMFEDSYRVTAYKKNKKPFGKAQDYLDTLKERFDFIDNYDGFILPNTLRDQTTRMARNILTSDNASGALFINLRENYSPDEFKVLDCDLIFFDTEKNKKRHIPYTYENGKKVYLDYMNFLWQPMDADAMAYMGNNPLRPSLRTTFTKMEFFDNLRKVLKNQAWPKIKVVLDEQAVIKMAPPDVKANAKALVEFLNDYLDKMEDQLTGIDPDQNIIVYDTIKEISFLESRNAFDPTPISNLLDSELISGAKAPPSTVGKGGSTRTGEGLASAELVIFRRSIKAIRGLVENIYSRAFSICMRLQGFQGYAQFKLKEFTLRPPEESAQYDSIRQDTLTDAWLLGSIGDKEKDRKIRQMHELDGPKPGDAKEREDPRTKKVEPGQTERTPLSRESKEKKREETRKTRKTGSDKK